MKKSGLYLLLTITVLLVTTGSLLGAETISNNIITEIINVQKYNRSIHVMAMLLVGFGFLMVFVRKYGRSALTATFLLVSVAIPMYFVVTGGANGDIDKMILAEFGAASLLICAGSVLGRLKMIQYILLGLLFIPCYAFNEWIVLSGGLGLIGKDIFVDVGGSIVIHAFGALFGLGAIFSLTTKTEYETPVESDDTSDRYSLLGSMVLWVFWPSFCAALVPPADIPATVINVVLSLCGATIATYFASSFFRKKITVEDVANASLAGGVAIGATCNFTTPTIAFVIGIIAGVLSTFGFAVLKEKIQKLIKKTDTCGVLYLHGLPGLFGGVAALFVVSSVNPSAQIIGIVITAVLALITGLIVGRIVTVLGRVSTPYADEEELEVEN